MSEENTATTILEERAIEFQKKWKAIRALLAENMGMEMNLTLAELAGITFDAIGDAPITAAADGAEWRTGVRYEADMTVLFEGKEYRVLQAHLSQDGWRPTAQGVYLFEEIVQQMGPWAVNVNYKIGDLVTYQNKTYECISQHLSQASWYPGALGIYLWREVR